MLVRNCQKVLHSWKSKNLFQSFSTNTKLRSEFSLGQDLANTPLFDDENNASKYTAPSKDLSAALKPKDVIAELDKHIVGQNDAKKAVAIALRNRWRRNKLSEELRNEVIPKNILLIGPTGCGKTEIARRMAKLCEAPFIKVEATKFTEVGFHGRDVDMIIRDLVDIAVQQTKNKLKSQYKEKAKQIVEEKILDALVGESAEETRQQFLQMLREGDLDGREIEIDVPVSSKGNQNGMGMLGGRAVFQVQDFSELFGKMGDAFGGGSKYRRKKMKIENVRPILEEHELEKLVTNDSVTKEAIRSVEQEGIVFIDEIDKICSNYKESSHPTASDEGVQRDLLPVIEGTTINTKYGNVNTDHILFICSGAFHSVKPSDLLAELQGRLPIRVELKGLTEDDLYRILTEPQNNLIRQNKELLKTEDVTLDFADEAIREVAKVAAEVNKSVENIGARRLHTIVEKVLEDVSFNAPDLQSQTVVIDKDYVRKAVEKLMKKNDLSKFIL